jgi:type III restriction enzyme
VRGGRSPRIKRLSEHIGQSYFEYLAALPDLVLYPLACAMADGFVKEPAVVTRKDFDPAGMQPAALEKLKLEDGVGLHESVKVQLETWAHETGNTVVKPFLLVVARDTTHAAELLALIQSPEFFEGRYRDRVTQVDSSQTGAAEEAMIERLLKVEHAEEPTEVVIHVSAGSRPRSRCRWAARPTRRRPSSI